MVVATERYDRYRGIGRIEWPHRAASGKARRARRMNDVCSDARSSHVRCTDRGAPVRANIF